MSKEKQRKQKIQYFLTQAKFYPQETIDTLKSLQRGKHNTPTYHKIQRLIDNLKKQQTDHREANYRKYAAQYGINIPLQSPKNIEILKDRVSKLYTTEEIQTFKDCWYNHIVPDLCLKHVTRDWNAIRRRGYLLSVNQRKFEGDTATNDHTNGQSARRDHLYFTLGLKDHQTVQYWDNKPELITIDLGKAYLQKENPLPGLWIASHISRQVIRGHLPGKYFGDTLRTVSYDVVNYNKTTKYRYSDGTEKSITHPAAEDTFSAENGLNEIFDGLFYQIIEEIYYIQGSFYTKLFSDPKQILRASMLHMFIPDVYPEAKVSSGMLSVKSAWLTVTKTQALNGLLIQKFHKSIINVKDGKVIQLLTEHPELLEAKRDDKTPLLLAMNVLAKEKSAPQLAKIIKIIMKLLAEGADINANNLDETPFSVLLSSTHDIAFDLLKKLLQGIADRHFSLIRHCVNLINHQRVLMLGSYNEPILLALRAGNWRAFELLQQYGVTPKSSSPLLRNAYLGQLKDSILKLKTDYKADVNAESSGDTVLTAAVTVDDDQFVFFLKDHFPELNINQKDNDGHTPLHIAVNNKSAKALEALLKLGADPSITDKHHQTPYMLLLQKKDYNAEAEYSIYGKTKLLNDIISIKQQSYQDKINELLTVFTRYNASIIVDAPNIPLQDFQCAAVIVKKLNNLGHSEFLFIKKANQQGKPQQRFLLPGGLKDAADKDLMETCNRECLEETNIQVSSSEFYRFEKVIDNRFYQFHVGKADLSHKALLEPIASDDVAEAVWIDWSQVEKRKTASKNVMYYYQDNLIEPSNALLVEAEINNTLQQQSSKIEDALTMQFQGRKLLTDAMRANDLNGFKKLVVEEGINTTGLPLLCTAIATGSSDWLELYLELKVDLDAELKLANYFAPKLPHFFSPSLSKILLWLDA